MRTVLLVCLLVLVFGCASRELRCDGRLEPINVSAGAVAAQPRAGSAAGQGDH